MTSSTVIRPLPGSSNVLLTSGGVVMLRGDKRTASPRSKAKLRARHTRFAPQSLSLALASAFNAASLSLSQTLAGLSISLAGLASAQTQPHPNLPQGGVAVHGSAAIVQNGNTLNITTTNGAGNKSAINWQSFNIGAGHTTHINQPNAQSSSLNRVITNAPSQIYGTLRSNGNVILVNQNGIAVGAGGVVDTAGFTASTLNMSDADYKAKRLRFEGNALGGGSGGILVEGEDRSDPNNIRPGAMVRSSNGDVMLFAPHVTVGKGSQVKADNGNVIVGAGQSVEVTGRGLEGVKFLIQGADNKAINLGTLQGNAVGVFAGTLRHSGVIQAQQASMEGGRVVLRAVKDVEIVKDASLAAAPQIIANGGVNAQGVAQAGGSVRVESTQGNVTVGAGAQISANAGHAVLPSNLTPNQQLALVKPAGGAIEIIANQGVVNLQAGSQISATGQPGGTVRIFGAQEARVAAILNVSSPSLGAPDAVGTLQLIRASDIGGTIQILSPEYVNLATGAQLLASGDAGGGTILVGGDYQGANAAITNAQNTNVAQDVLLEANARVNGNGGKVIVWADEVTKYGGFIRATGGDQGGDGGFGETSGKKHLIFRGRADLTARRGRTGTLYLDPDTITINGGSGTSNDDASNGINTSADEGGNLLTNYTIYEADIESLGATANVILEAARSINFQGTFTNDDLAVSQNLTLTTRNGPADGSLIGGVSLGGWGNSSFTISAGGSLNITAGTSYAGLAATAPYIFSNSGAILLLKSGAASGNVTVEAAGLVQLAMGTTIQAASGQATVRSKLSDVTLGWGSTGSAMTVSGKSVAIQAQSAGALIDLQNGAVMGATGSGGVLIEADRLTLDAASTVVSAAGSINVRPFSTNRKIVLGGTDDLLVATSLQISQAEYNRFSASSALRFGNTSSYTGNIQVGDSSAFNFGFGQVALLTNGGNISQAQAFSSNSLRLSAGSIHLSHASNSFYQLTAKSTTGSINIASGGSMSLSTVDGQSGLDSATSITLSDTSLTGSRSVNFEAGNDITAEGNINIQAFETLTVYSSSYVIDSNTDNTGNSGAINLGNAVIEASTSARNLLLDTSTSSGVAGDVSIGNVVANTLSQYMGGLTIYAAAATAANNGNINLPASIAASGGNITLIGRSVLSQDSTLTTFSNGQVNLQGEVQGNQNLTINAHGQVNLQAEMGTGTALADLAVNSANVISLSNRVRASGHVSLQATGAGLINMTSSGEIEGIGTGAGLTIHVLGQGGVQLSKITANSNYSANVLVGTAGAAITSAANTLVNFSGGLSNLTLGALGARAQIGSSATPIRVENITGTGLLSAFGHTELHIKNTSTVPLNVQTVSVDTGTASTANLEIESVGNLLAGNVFAIGTGTAYLDLRTQGGFTNTSSIAGTSNGNSDLVIAADISMDLGEGSNSISNLKAVNLRNQTSGRVISIDDALTPAAGTLSLSYGQLSRIGPTVGHVLVGNTDLVSTGNIVFAGTSDLITDNFTSKDYSFFSNGNISSTAVRNLALSSAGFSATGNIALSNAFIYNPTASTSLSLAAKAGGSIDLKVADTDGVTIATVGAALPSAVQIKAIESTGGGDIRLINTAGAISSGAGNFDLYSNAGEITVRASGNMGSVANPLALHASDFTLGSAGTPTQSIIAVALTRNSSSTVQSTDVNFDAYPGSLTDIYVKAGFGTSTLEMNSDFANTNPVHITLANSAGNIRVTQPNVQFSGAGSFTFDTANTTFETITTIAAGHTVRATGGNTTISSGSGWLRGGGTLDNAGKGLLVNGTVSPGSSSAIGTLTVTGNLIMGSAGVLDMQLATTASNGDRLTVGGNLSAAGTLRVTESNLSTTTAGTAYTLATIGGTSSGSFVLDAPTANLSQALGANLTVTPNSLTNNWINSAGGNWFVAGNWSRNVIPTTSTDVVIDMAGFNPAVSQTSPASVNSIRLGDSLSIGASLSSAQGLNVVSGGTLYLTSGSGTLTGGNVLISSGATMFWAGGAIGSNSDTTQQFQSNGVLNISGPGSSYQDTYRNWTNNGVINWGGGRFTELVDNASGRITFTNTALGQINLNTTRTGIDDFINGGLGSFVNQGTITSASSNAATTTRLNGSQNAFQNTGTVLSNVGTLSMGSSGSLGADTGGYTVASAAGLEFNASRFFNSGASIEGAGLLKISAGPVTVGAGVGLGVLTNGSVSLGAQLNLNTGSARTINRLNMSAGGVLFSGDAVNVGSLTSAGGRFEGTGLFTTTGASSMTDSFERRGGQWQNLGVMTVSGANGTIYLNAGSTLTNAAAGQINLNGNNSTALYTGSGTNRFVNQGTMTSGAGAVVRGIFANFDNSGAVRVTDGELELNNGGTESGSYTVSSGAALRFKGGGARHFTAGGLFGSGRLNLSSSSTTTLGNGVNTSLLQNGTLNIDGASLTLNTGSGFTFASTVTLGTNGATLSIANNMVGALHVLGAVSLSSPANGTQWTLPALTTSTLGMASGAFTSSADVLINNFGTLNFTNAGTLSIGNSFTNQGLVNLTGNGVIAGLGTFNNTSAGTVSRGTSAGTFSINSPFAQGGIINANSGTLAFANALTNFGLIQGTARINVGAVGLTNAAAGTIMPGGNGTLGTLTIASANTTLATGNLRFELDGINSDRLTLIGNVTLGAPVKVSELGAGVLVGNNYSLLTYSGSAMGASSLDSSSIGADVNFGALTLTAGSPNVLSTSVIAVINRFVNNAGSDDWHTNANWSRNHVPTASEDVIINATGASDTNRQVTINSAGASARSILLSGDDDLHINNSKTLSLSGVSSSTIGSGGATLYLDSGSITQAVAAGALTVLANGSVVSNGNSQISLTTFDNAGYVNVNSGTLLLAGDGADVGGSYTINSGSNLWLMQGDRYFGSGSTNIVNDGLLSVRSGSRLFASGDGSNWTGSGTLEAHSGSLVASGFNGSIGNLKIAPAGTFSTTSGTDSLTVYNTFSANGGVINGSGTLITAGASNVTGSLALNGSYWENSGSLDFAATGSSDAIQVFNGAVFTNTRTGYITGSVLQNFAIFEGATLSASGSVVNHGTMELTGVSGDTHFLDVHQFDNLGTLRLSGGARYVLTQTNFDQQGVLALAGNSILGVLGLNNTGTIEGAGTVDLAGGNFVNIGTLAPGDDGGVSGIGTLTVMGNLTLGNASKQRFDLQLGGSDRIDVHGDLNFSGSAPPEMIFNELNSPSFLGGELVTLITSTGSFTSDTHSTTGSSDVTFRSTADMLNKRFTAEVIGINNRWTTIAGGDWINGGNWSRNTSPNAYHDVSIDVADPTGRVTISGGTNAAARSVRVGENHAGNELYISGASGANLVVNNAAEASALTKLVRIYGGSSIEMVGGGTLALGQGFMQIDSGAEFRGLGSTLSAYSGGTGTAQIHNNGLMTNIGGTGRWGLSSGGRQLEIMNHTGGTMAVSTGTLQIDTDFFEQDGTINLGSSGNFRQLNANLNNNGIINFSGGSIDNGTKTLHNYASGQINGHGTITAFSLINSGTISVGTNPAFPQTLQLNGDFTNESSGILKIDAMANGVNDVLNIVGNAVLDGDIALTATNGHAFGSSQAYAPVTVNGTALGSFSTASGFGLLNIAQNNAAGAAFSLSLAATQIEWIGTDGDWSNTANWQDSNHVNRLPTASDTVLINPSGIRTVTVSSGTNFTLLSLVQSDDTILINTSGTLTLLGGDTLAGTLHVNGGTLTNAGANTGTSAAHHIVVDSGRFNVNANLDVQTLAINSTANNASIIGSGTTLTVAGNSYINGSVAGAGMLVNRGLMSLNGVTIAPTLRNENLGAVFFDNTVTLSALDALSGSAMQLNTGAIFIHQAGDLTLPSGTYLSGDGTIDVGASHTLTLNGVVNPGINDTTAGQLHVIGNLDASNADLKFNLISHASYDKISVTGNFALPSSAITLEENTPTIAGGDIYSLITANALTGTTPNIQVVDALDNAVSDVTMGPTRLNGNLEAQAISVQNYWQSAADGNWNDSFNWSRQHVPNQFEDVVIAPTGSKTISLTAANGQARSVVMPDTDDTLVIAGTFINLAKLTVENEFHSNGTVEISGSAANAGSLYTSYTNPEDTSIGVLRMQGKAFLVAGGDIFTNGATMTAAAGLSPQIQGAGWYLQSGEHLLQGTGSIDFSGAMLHNESLATLSIASGLTVFGASVVNEGTLNIAFGSTLSLASASGNSFTNEHVLAGAGTVKVSGGGNFKNETTGIIRPGDAGIGELTLTAASGSQIYLDAGSAEIQLTSSGVYDKLNVSGPLITAPAFSLVLSETSPFLAGGEVFQPLSFTSTQSGGFPSVDSTAISSNTFSLNSASAFGSAFTLTASGGFVTHIFWDGGGDGISWSDANNWSTNLLPTAGQNVTLNPAGSGSVTLGSGVNVAGLVGLTLDATDALFFNTGSTFVIPGTNLALNGTVFVNGGSVTLPSTPLAISGGLNLQSGQLIGTSSGGSFTGVFNWSGGQLSGAGQYTALNLNLAGTGTRLLNGVTLNAGASTLNGGSLVLQSGGLLSTGSSGMLVTGGGTLAFAGGSLSTAGLTNDGLVRIDSGNVSLSNTATQTGDFTIASGASMAFANDVSLSAAASIAGGTWSVSAGKTVTTQGVMDRGAGGVTFVNGDLILGGDFETEQLVMLTGGHIVGGGQALRVTKSWNDSNIGVGAVAGLASATITQAAGNLNFAQNLSLSGDLVLTALAGDIDSGASQLVAGGQAKMIATGLIDANVQAATVFAASSGNDIVLDIAGSSQIAALATAAGKTASLTTTGNLSQTGAINTAGGIVISAGANNVSWVNAANTFGQGVRSVSANSVEITSSNTSGLMFSGNANQVALHGGAVQLGSSATTLSVSGPLTVVASGNISQGTALNVTGLTSLNTSAGNITLNTASSYSGGLAFSSFGNTSISNLGLLQVRGQSGGTLSLTSTGAVSQFGTGGTHLLRSFGAASVVATGQNVTLDNPFNDFNSLHITAHHATVSESNEIAVSGALSGIFALKAGGTVTSSGLLTANGLTLTAAGGTPIDVNLSNSSIGSAGATFGNAGNGYSRITYANTGVGGLVAPIDAVMPGGSFVYTQAGAAALPSITVDNLTVNATGVITQFGAINAPIASFNAPGQAVNLSHLLNSLGQIDVVGSSAVINSNSVIDPNITASGSVSMNVLGIEQTAGRVVQAPSLSVQSGSAVDLLGLNRLGAVSVTAAQGIDIHNRDVSLVLNGVTAGSGHDASIVSNSSILQGTGAITADAVTLTGSQVGTQSQPVLLASSQARLTAQNGSIHARNSLASELLGMSATQQAHYTSDAGTDIEAVGDVSALDIQIASGRHLTIGNSLSAVSVNASNTLVLQGQNVTIQAGATANASVDVQAQTSIDITATGNFVLQGGSENNTYAKVLVQGPMRAQVSGTAHIRGGSGTGAYALLDPLQGATLELAASAITLQGGSGAGAYGAIVSDGDIILTATSLNLQAGLGSDADAVVISRFGRITQPADCNGCLVLSSNPQGDGLATAGLYGVDSSTENSAEQILQTVFISTQVTQAETILESAQDEDEQNKRKKPEITIESEVCP